MPGRALYPKGRALIIQQFYVTAKSYADLGIPESAVVTDRKIHAFYSSYEKQEFSGRAPAWDRRKKDLIKDTGWKEYFSDNRRYADLINGLGCGGRQMVREDDLQELDSQGGFFEHRDRSHGFGPFRNAVPGKRAGKRAGRRRIKVRDMVRRVAFGINFAVIGIENQEMTDYSIALRNMSYDVGEYEKQAAGIRRENRRHPNGLSAGEYLYGFRKNSRLHPVVTFILYSGAKDWDGPKSLHGMLDFTDIPSGMKDMVQDYRMNLIEIRKLEDTGVFRTDLRQVFDFIRYAEDKNALAKLVEHDPCFREMEEDAYDVVTCYAHVEELAERKESYRKDGKVDMCTAIREMVQDGIELGKTQGIELGKTQGTDEKTRIVVRNMIRRGMSDEDIEAIAECSPELVREMRAAKFC